MVKCCLTTINYTITVQTAKLLNSTNMLNICIAPTLSMYTNVSSCVQQGRCYGWVQWSRDHLLFNTPNFFFLFSFCNFKFGVVGFSVFTKRIDFSNLFSPLWKKKNKERNGVRKIQPCVVQAGLEHDSGNALKSFGLWFNCGECPGSYSL